MRAFINEGLKEFIITKIISPHPAGILAFDFRITYIQQKKWLVTEFLMENAGLTLTEFMNNPANNLDFVKYFTQLSSLMQHMEKEQIFHNDVKFDNCLVDPTGNFRIIDYDVTKAEGYYSPSTKVTTNNILGYTNGYVPPEIYNQIEEAISNHKKPSAQNVMPWRADIYSCGILALCISGAIDRIERSNIETLDKYKVNKAEHQYIIEKCKLVQCNSDALSENMQYVLEVCLSYDPKDRITFKQLHYIMLKIQDKNYNLKKLEKDVEIFRKENKQFQTRNQLKGNNQNLEAQLNDIMQKNLKLEEEFKQLHKRYAEAINSLDSNKNQLEEFKRKNEDLEESNNQLQEIITKNNNEKSELIVKIENSMASIGSNFILEITDFSKVIPLFESVLKENKNLKDENLKLKKLIQELENSNKAIVQTNQKPSKSTPKIAKQIADPQSPQKVENTSSKNLREKIQKRISEPSFWFLYKMNLTKSEILQILFIGSSSTTLKGIFLLKNDKFDEECGKAYEKFISKNNSILGIDLRGLNFSKKQKQNIIYLAKKEKQNVKVAFIERDGTDDQEANQIAKNLGWNLSISKKVKCK